MKIKLNNINYLSLVNRLLDELFLNVENFKTDQDKASHELRKTIKKLRTILLLKKQIYTPNDYATIKTTLRAISQRVANYRQFFVFKRLVVKISPIDINGILEKQLTIPDQSEGTILQIIEESIINIQSIKNLVLNVGTNDTVAISLKKEIKAFHKFANHYFLTDDKESLHSWRKKGKILQYTLFLLPAESFIKGKIPTEIPLLTEIQGKIHDNMEFLSLYNQHISPDFQLSLSETAIMNKTIVKALYHTYFSGLR